MFPVMPLTGGRPVRLLLVLFAVLMLTMVSVACSDDDDDDGGDETPTTEATESTDESTASATEEATASASASASAAASTEESGDAMRTITDAAGHEVEVPADPQRVVTLSEQDLDASLALDVTPIGTVTGRGQDIASRYLGDRTAGIPLIGTLSEPDLEAIVGLEPDLILAGGSFEPSALELLSDIAPTVVTTSAEDTWKTQFEHVGEALNRADGVAAYFDEYEARVAEVTAGLGENAGARISIVRWNPGGPGYMLQDAFSSSIVADLGLTRPELHQQPGKGHSPALSLEQLAEIDGDWIFIGTLSDAGEAVDAMNVAMENPLFQGLGAVQAGHVVPIDGSLWTSTGGPLGAFIVLDDLEGALASS